MANEVLHTAWVKAPRSVHTCRMDHEDVSHGDVRTPLSVLGKKVP